MKKYVVLIILTVGLWGCKDEFNLPFYDSYIDSTPPTLTIISPAENATFTGDTVVQLSYELKDDYKLKSFNIRIIPGDINLPEFRDTVAIDDSIFSYNKLYTIPKDSAMRYEINIAAEDSLGFGSSQVYFFNYQ
jgi:hypothetical protein